MGRRSGGMTGRTDRIIHSGRLPRAPEGLDQAQPLDRLLAALAGRGPDLAVQLLGELVELHALDQLAHRLGAHAGAEQARATTHARAVLAVELAVVEAVERRLGQHHARLQAL